MIKLEQKGSHDVSVLLMLKLVYVLASLPYWLLCAFLLNQTSTSSNLSALFLISVYFWGLYRLCLQAPLMDLRYRFLLKQSAKIQQTLQDLESESAQLKQSSGSARIPQPNPSASNINRQDDQSSSDPHQE